MVKAFDLDAPGLPKELRHKFRCRSRYFSALLEDAVCPFDLGAGKWKLMVEVVPVVSRPLVRDLLGVLAIEVEGDALGFESLPQSEATLAMQAWFREGVASLSRQGVVPLETVLPKLQSGLERVSSGPQLRFLVWRKGLKSASGRLTCDVCVGHGPTAAQIQAVFRSKSHEVGRVTLVSAMPNEFVYVPLLGSVAWIDDARVVLTSKDGSQQFVAVAPELAS